MDYKEKYLSWLSNDYFDENTKIELEKIKNDEKEIEERFFKDLDFGTGGLRGIMGAGTNRMNKYTVRKATQGLANYILKAVNDKEKIVCIAYDSRNNSYEFATDTALVFNANGIKTYIFDSLRPTPQLSFAVIQKNATAGIVVTASHNPAEYNGYKVYWSGGYQVSYPQDEEIIKEVNKITDYSKIIPMDKNEAIKKSLFNIFDSEMDDKYIEAVKNQSINKNIIKEFGNDLSIIYTPLNGAGNIPVRRILKQLGFNNVCVVKEQEMPDGNFPTIGYPNPEFPKVFELGLKLAKEKNADIIIATDPDSDRLGVVVKNNNNEYIQLTGNMVGFLFAHYIITQKKENNILPKNPVIISTIVSTNLTRKIAEENNVTFFETLTGFKYMGQMMEEFSRTKEYNFLFGFEESIGYLIGDYTRDKDAVSSVAMICEIASYYKKRNMNLLDGIMEIYNKYGFYKDGQKSIELKGMDGLEKIKNTMINLREKPIIEINNVKVKTVKDYKISEEENLITKEKSKLEFPSSNVLYYEMENDFWFCVRPSGTEPKIKIYCGVIGRGDLESDKNLEDFKTDVINKVNNYIE